MDVETIDEQRRSVVAWGQYLGGVGLLVGGLLLPALVVEGYQWVLATVVLVAAAGLAIRGVASSLLALSPSAPPSIDLPAEPPTVSVLVTAYDEADVLAETIAACRELDYPDDALEVVCCYESASSDGTARIAASAAAADPRVVAHERPEPPGGKAAATNEALGRARGEIVCVLDADQRFEPTAVRRAVRWFLAEEATWCVTGRRYGTNPRASLVALFATVEHHVAERIEFVARDVLGGFTLFTGGQAFFRADALDELGPFDEEVLLEDVDMAARIHARGGRIRVDPAILTYERNPTSLRAWWHQRKRWARGGLQAARRHLYPLATGRDVRPIVRADACYTFGLLLVAPMLVVASPVVILGVGSSASIAPFELVVLALVAIAPVLASTVVFLVDRRAGRAHARREYLVPFACGPYLALQGLVVLVAFLDEFVLDRPATYVPS